MDTHADRSDVAARAWLAERPELDVDAMATLARFARVGLLGGRRVDAVFADAGLDRGEFDVLATLRRGGGDYSATPSALAAALLTTRGGMTKRVDRLARRGFVRRVLHGTDGRSRIIELTASGVALIDELIALHTANEEQLLAVLTPDERAALDLTLRKLLRSLED